MMSPAYVRALLSGVAAIAIVTGCGGKDAAITPEAVKVENAEISKADPSIPAGQLPTGVAPTAYRLHLVTDPAEAAFAGTVEIDLQLDADHKRIWLHALGPEISSAKAVLADGTELPASVTGDQAPGGVTSLDFETAVPAGTARLVIDYSAPYNLALAGLYKVIQSDKPYLASQMEPIDARRMVPSFDEPRFKTPWTLTIDAPEGFAVVTNGAETGTEALENGMVRHRFATTRPIQSYLVALAVGPYDMRAAEDIPASALRDTPIPLRGFAPAGKGDKLETALDETTAQLLYLEDYFNYPYPYGKLDLIAAPDFAYGAMENAGAIIYREAALLIDERTSLNRKRGILTTHAHELAHQWFGNLVTPEWWNDIWLNEAFATWMSYKTMHAVDPNGGWKLAPISAGLGAMSADSLMTARQIRNPIERNGDIMDAFDSITYRKGGSVLNMFESYLGEEAFREGIRIHMTRHEDGTATADDFMKNLADGSGQSDVVAAFTSFISQPGIPMLDVTLSCPTGDTGTLAVTQTRYAPLGSEIDTGGQTWSVPFAATVHGPAGTRTVRQMLSGANNTIDIEGDCPDWVMPNANGAGYWRFSLDSAAAAALAENFDALSEAEQLVYADSLKAGFQSGQVSAEALLTGLKSVAKGGPDAVQSTLSMIGTLNRLAGDAHRPALQNWVQTTYGPLSEYLNSRTAAGLTAGEILLRDRLHAVMLEYGDDETARAAMVEDAKAYVGFGGLPTASAVAPQDLGIAMRLGTREGGEAFFDKAVAYVLSSENQNERAGIISALVAEGDLALVSALLTRTANKEAFSGNELYTAYLSAFSRDDDLDTIWEQFQTEFDTIVEKLPAIRRPQIGGISGAFCSAEKAETAADFFKSKADLIEGYERSLAQGMERASLCSAMKTAKTDELIAALGD